MIKSGEKTEEYREIKWFWLNRLFFICRVGGEEVKEVDRELVISELLNNSEEPKEFMVIPRSFDEVEFLMGLIIQRTFHGFRKR